MTLSPRADVAPPLIIGIAGGTGSGKTTLAHKVVEAMPEGRGALVQHDWYYLDRSGMTPEARDRINFDEPAALDNDLMARHLRMLKSGEAVHCPQYDFANHTRKKEFRVVEPRAVIVVEGILLFAVDALRSVIDLRVFVDTDDDIRLMRRMIRDVRERGRDVGSVERQYLDTVRPMHQKHVAPTRAHAHLIVPEGGENTPALDVIVGHLLHGLSLR